MEVRAIAKSVRVSPRKMRLVADAIRNRAVDDAFHVLAAMQKRAATPLEKALKSAVANATNNAQLQQSNLVIASVQISETQALKRFRPSTRGRVHPYKKKGSTIRIVVSEKVVTQPASSVALATTKKTTEAVKVEEQKEEMKGGKK